MEPLSSNVRLRIAAVLSMAFAIAGCDNGPGKAPLYELAGSAMGTTWSIKVASLPDGTDRIALRDELESLLARTEQALSTYVSGSVLSRFNASRSTDWIAVPVELCTIVDVALGISEMTGGAFDVTVGPLVNLWGFGPDGSISEPPPADQIASVRAATGYRKLHADCDRPALKKDRPDLYVDLSAFAKGYTVDKLAHVLDTRGVVNYLVEIGGELKARGRNARDTEWAIAVEEPLLTGRSVQTIVGLRDSGMATSGDYRNYFRHADTLYSHTIDPRTGAPIAHDGASVTVVAESTGFADAMATALLVLGPDAGMEFADRHAIAAYFLVRSDDGLDERRSERFAAEVSLL